MRRLLVLAFAVAALPLAAQAKTVSLGPHSENEVQGACKKAGGTFYSSPGGYGCTKQNCDGKGGNCDVICTAKNCVGNTPAIQHGGKLTLPQVLTFSPATRGGPPSPGMLETGPGGSPQSPSGVGTPKPTAPPSGRLY